MKNIKKQIHLDIPPAEAYSKFINDINQWWTKEYRWCQHHDATMIIDLKNKVGSEESPDGEVVQWGQILDTKEGEEIELLWKMDPNRQPIDKPDQCSRLRITFSPDKNGNTDMEITHSDLEKLESYPELEQYHRILDSDDGWIYLMQKFKQHCQEHEQSYVES